MTTTEPGSTSLAVVERYVREVLNGEGPATLDELISNGLYRQRVGAFRAAFPDLRVVTHEMLALDDLVAIHASATGTHRGFYEGLPPTGRRWRATCTALYRVAGGQIAELWDTWDRLSILEQLGGVERAAGASA